MAAPAVLPFDKFKLQLETATPGVFSAPCGFESRSHTRDIAVAEQMIPDCDETLPAAPRREVESVSHSVQGDGVLALGDLSVYRTWADGGTTKKVRVVYDVPLAQGGGYYEGLAVLSAFNVAAQRKRTATVTVTIAQAGAWTWTNAAA